MIVYYSILVFTCIVALFGSFLHSKRLVGYADRGRDITDTIKYEKSIGFFMALLTFSLMAYFVGMRSYYGDTYAYIWQYQNLNLTLHVGDYITGDYENKGFIILMYLVKKYISHDYNVWFFILSVFNAVSIAKLYYKYSCNFVMSAFLFIASGSFTWMMNGMRQFLAVTLILFFFDYVVERKTIKFLIIVAIAITIHGTALLWIPIYFIVHFKPWSIKIWICVLLTLLVFFSITQFTDWMDSTVEGTEYSGAGYALTHYTNEDGTVDNGVNFIRVIIAAVPPAIALWRRKYVEEKATPLINICINLSVASVGVYLLGVVTSGILVGRVPIYFNLLNFVLLPWLFENTFHMKDRRIMKILCYAFYFLYFYYSFAVQGAGYYGSDKLGLYV